MRKIILISVNGLSAGINVGLGTHNIHFGIATICALTCIWIMLPDEWLA